MKQNTISIFYSYSHRDEYLREALETHLSILRRNGTITSWHDRKISPGSEWEKEIDERIKTADIILLLVSPDFIASDYCFGKELSIAIENHESRKSRVIPIIIRPVEWTDAPFAKLQALPTDALPVTSWPNQDEAWLDIARGIKLGVNEALKLKNRDGEDSGLLSLKEVLTKEIDRLEAIYEVNEDKTCTGLSTGLRDLNYLIDGLHNSQLTVVASRPSMGKTNFSIGLAAQVAIIEKLPVAYFSMSLTSDQLTRRLIASIGRINYHDFLRGYLNDEDWPRLTSTVNLLAEAPLYIDEGFILSIDQLRTKALNFKRTRGLSLLVIDSLQHLVFQINKSNETNSDLNYSKALKHLARELQIPILITSSLPRNIDSRVNKRPIIKDLLEFEELESDADVILFLYRDGVYHEDSIDRGIAELIIAKNVNGRLGTIRTTYFDEWARFEDFVTYERN